MDRDIVKLMKFVKFARDLSTLSTCRCQQVGTIVMPIDFSRVYSIGYNGGAAGEDDCCRGHNDQECPEQMIGYCGCLHAEINAIIKLEDQIDCLMYSTHAPCEQCATAIVNSQSIFCVIWEHPYRNTLGLERLARAGIATPSLEEFLASRTS